MSSTGPLERVLRQATGQKEKDPFRLVSIDLWRGISMVFVITSHLFFGLTSMQMTSAELLEDPLIAVLSIFSTVGQMFFVLSGASIILSMERQVKGGKDARGILLKEIKRGLVILAIGIAYDPVVYFHFGLVDALHAIGACNIIVAVVFYPFLQEHQLCNEMPGTEAVWKASIGTGSRLFIIAGLAVAFASPAMRFLVGYPNADPSIEPLLYAVPPVSFVEMVQAWLTTSFFPIFPCLAYFFFGAWIGCRLASIDMEPVPNRSRRDFARSLAIAGFVIMVLGLGFVLAGEEISGPAAMDPQYLQPDWVIELTFQLQPITTGPFFFYLGMNFFALGALSFIFEVSHRPKNIARISTIFRKLRLQPFYNMLLRFSRFSFTIYILQYTWIPVLRLLTILTGEPLLYSIPYKEAWITLAIIAGAIFLFALLARFLDRGDRSRFTVEHLLKRIT